MEDKTLNEPVVIHTEEPMLEEDRILPGNQGIDAEDAARLVEHQDPAEPDSVEPETVDSEGEPDNPMGMPMDS